VALGIKYKYSDFDPQVLKLLVREREREIRRFRGKPKKNGKLRNT